MAYIYPFRMTSTTATLLLIDPVMREVIIGVRSDGAWVYPGADSLPGGFMEARYVAEGEKPEMLQARQFADGVLGMKLIAEEYHEGENSVDCAIREGEEELSVKLLASQIRLFDVRANARTDTRAHVTNVCYYAELTPEQTASLAPGDDIQEIKRLPLRDLDVELPYIALAAKYPMAFNHFELMIQGIAAYRKEKRFEELEAEVARLRQLLSDASWTINADRQGGA